MIGFHNISQERPYLHIKSLDFRCMDIGSPDDQEHETQSWVLHCFILFFNIYIYIYIYIYTHTQGGMIKLSP